MERTLFHGRSLAATNRGSIDALLKVLLLYPRVLKKLLSYHYIVSRAI